MALTYTPIATQTLSSAASSVTFSSISGSYTDLVLVTTAKNATGAQYRLQLSFNGDRGTSIYSVTKLTGNGTTATSSRATNATYGAILIGTIGSTNFDNAITHIMNYANTTTYKTVLSRGNETAAEVNAEAGLWRSTAAITSLTLDLETSINFSIGSTFSLYGIASSAVGAKATGGNLITSDGTYWYHTFTSSGTFTPSSTLSCDVLVVAGGGGGGRTVGGGGGAGGLLGFTGQSVSTAQTITVGAGGAGGTSFTGTGTTGSDSQFGALTLVKGGGGAGGGDGVNGLTGGSGGGGGGAGTATTGGAGTSSQGFAGSAWGGTGLQIAGGGGGSSAAATNKNGANGVTTYSSWGLATGTGENVSGTVYYAGGGGAGTNSGAGGGATVAGTGGYGGGSAGRVLASAGVPTAATANTGGGGGGSGGNGDSSNGAAGGSGIVIVRYPV